MRINNPWKITSFGLAAAILLGGGTYAGSQISSSPSTPAVRPVATRTVTASPVASSTVAARATPPKPTVKPATAKASSQPSKPVAQSTPVAPSISIYDCGDTPVTEPGNILLACGDNSTGISNITWSQWNDIQAMGSGTAYVNDCNPDCQQGTLITSPVSVVLNGYTLGSPNTYEAMTVSGATGQYATLFDGDYELNDPGPTGVCKIGGGC
jgi:hypothetical protein